MNDVAYHGRAAYLEAADALVVADLHVGRVAGDVLHVHGSVPTGAVDALGDIVQTVESADATPVFVNGNHDTLLDELDIAGNPRILDEYRLQDGTVVCHGHEEPDHEPDADDSDDADDADDAEGTASTGPTRYVVGHEHPAIRIEGARHPCFLLGEDVYRGSDVLVLPALNRATSGTLVNRLGDAMSPVVGHLGRYRPVVVGDEPYEFPPLSEFAAML